LQNQKRKELFMSNSHNKQALINMLCEGWPRFLVGQKQSSSHLVDLGRATLEGLRKNDLSYIWFSVNKDQMWI
jgi:hypothetical protein